MTAQTGLSPAQQRLLAKLRSGRVPKAAPVVPRLADLRRVPLSFAQERIWLSQQMAGDLPLFNLSFGARIPVPLSVHEIQRRMVGVVRRHDALRASIHVVDGEPTMHIADEVPVEIEVLDQRHEDPDAITEVCRVAALEVAMRPYRLELAPLWRVAVGLLPNDERLIVVCVHHMIADGPSIDIIGRELAAGLDLPPLPMRFADFASWQRDTEGERARDDHDAYWLGKLAESPAPLRLPADRSRRSHASLAGATISAELGDAASAALHTLCRTEAATPFALVTAALALHLRRYCDDDRILLGMSVAGRSLPQTADLVGVFVNLVPLVLRVGGAPSLREMTRQVSAEVSESVRHGSTPFDRIQRELRRDGLPTPHIQVCVNRPVYEPVPAGMSAVDLPVAPAGSQFELTMHLMPGDAGRLRVHFEYSAELFDASSAQLLLDTFVAGLTAALEDPDRRGEAAMDTAPVEPAVRDELLPEAVLRQAARTPTRCAVEERDAAMTYRELVRRARQVAAELRQWELPAGALVLVSMRRGTDLVPALLGCWFAGCGYLPIDPDQLAERTAGMVADAGAAAVVTSGDAWPSGVAHGLPVVNVNDRGSGQVDGAPEDWSAPQTHPLQIAYGIFTSGSTGRPKAALVTHGGIANRVRHSVRGTGIREADRVLQKTPLSFDAAGWEIFAPLTIGGTVVLAAPGVESDPAAMLVELAERRITVLQAVPSVLRHLLDVSGWERCSTLRLVCSAGEPLTGELCTRLHRRGVAEIENTYGPSECAIDVTSHRWNPRQSRGPVPIGRAIDGTRVRVIDAELSECAPGEEGELWLSGVAVGAGYVGRPDLTAAAFVPDPYGQPGALAYRSGDIGRREASGSLHFAGRRDRQLKVNGVRVEPAEITAVLDSHPDVRESAVVAVHGPGGHPLLCAYLATDVDLHAIRAHARLRLPTALMPGRWIAVPALPQTSSGKLDFVALESMERAHGVRTVEGGAALSCDEGAVAAIWAELIPECPALAPEDDFFAVGGHSLLLTRLAARLAAAFGREIPLAQLFTVTTVRDQAAALTTWPGDDDLDDLLAAAAPTPGPATGEVVLSSTQARLWFLHQLEPESPQYVVPSLTILHGELDAAVLAAALSALVRRHSVLRTRYVADAVGAHGVIDEPADLPLGRHRVGDEAGIAALVGELVERPFDLAAGPVVRADLVSWSDTDHLLVLCIHHIACDGASLTVLAEELTELYAAAREGRADSLAPVPLQFADIARWELGLRAGEPYRRRLGEWTDALAGLAPCELATDRPRPAAWDPSGAVHSFEIPAAVARDLTALGRAHAASPFMTRLAVFEALLLRRTGQGEIVVGTPVAARLARGTDRVVGPLTNTVVLRTQLTPDPSFVDVLAAVRTTCLDGFARQDITFDDVVDAVQPPRELARNPLFQIMFETDALDAAVTLPGTDASAVADLSWHTAKFDLTLGVVERSDGGLRGYVEYATALYDEATVERLATDFVTLVHEVVAAPGRPVSRAVLTGAPAVGTLELPAPAGSIPVALGPREAVGWHAARTPQKVAVDTESSTLTYDELDRAVAVAARRLTAQGIRAGECMAVCAERGAEVVVALLALLEIGAVYVALDPAHPQQRHADVLAQVGARKVLVGKTACSLPFPPGVCALPLQALCANVDDDRLASRRAAALHSRDLAYVLFTSGSTGRPKGVMIDRGAYRHHCAVIARAYDIGPEDRVVQLSSLVFDVAMDQIAATLLAGASLVIAGGRAWEPEHLADRIAAHGVTIMEITPAHYRELMRTVGPDDARLAGLRLMNVGSDVVTASDARAWYAAGFAGRFLCNYGPTEATVTCTLHPTGPDEAARLRAESALPIGRPVPGTVARILDRWLNPVPPGVTGELYLGGERLARGYAGRADLTADRFVPDPLGGAGERLYRTGDAVRLRADGAIEFLGRLDRQVKLRGFRIELGEIEARLTEHPQVRAAAVAAVDDLIAAYVVGDGDPEPAELREHLARSLPDYMLPSAWVGLERLPLTASGKVDRARLPRPDGDARLRARFQAPDEPVQQAVARVWSEVLGVEPIGLDDDFFLLGGHSLSATRVHALLRETFQIELPLRALFEVTTLRRLAEAIRQAVVESVERMSDLEVRSLLEEAQG
jgi:amino acid adenylation domain-containing protein